MPQWNPSIFTKLLDYAKKNGVERRYNTFYIKGVALVQCNQVSINVTVAKDHLHIFYDPVVNAYFAFSMPFFFQYPNAQQLFNEGKKLCSELEKMTLGVIVSPPSPPPKNADSDFDRIILSLSLMNDRVLIRSPEYYKAKDYVKLRYPECYEIVKYFGVKKETVKFMEAIYARQWDIAENTLTLLAMECTEPECVIKIGKFIDECRKVIINREVRELHG
jgi:hypothetical protein